MVSFLDFFPVTPDRAAEQITRLMSTKARAERPGDSGRDQKERAAPRRPCPLRLRSKPAALIGVLFIIATVFLFIGSAIHGPALSGTDPLDMSAGARDRATLGLLIEFCCVLAMAYVVLRLLEAVPFVAGELDKFNSITLAGTYHALGLHDPGTLAVLASSLVTSEPWSGGTRTIDNVTVLSSTLVLHTLLNRTRLIPRWISGWGLIAWFCRPCQLLSGRCPTRLPCHW